MSNVGERIKEIRKKRKLNQKDFAKAIGITQGALSEIENNNTKPSIDTIVAISQNFKVSANWLLTGEDVKVPNRKPTEEEADKLTQDIIDLYVKNGRIEEGEILTEEKREEILKEIQTVIDLANKLKGF